MDLGCHTLNMLDWLFGPIVVGLRPRQPTSCKRLSGRGHAWRCRFAFDSGVLGTGLWNFCSFAHHDCIEVIGERGRLAFATFGDGPIELETAQGTQQLPASTTRRTSSSR